MIIQSKDCIAVFLSIYFNRMCKASASESNVCVSYMMSQCRWP